MQLQQKQEKVSKVYKSRTKLKSEFLLPYFDLIFLLTQHSSIFQIISWNLIWNHKVYAQKVFWHVILHNHLCNALYIFFIKLKGTNVFPKHILKLKAHDQLSQARKKLFCWLIVNDYLCNNLCKFLIKTKSMYRWREGQNQWRKTPAAFTVLW